MKSIPLNPETEELARRPVWFEAPQQALADPVRFMAYAFAQPTHEEMKIIRCYLDDSDGAGKCAARHHRRAVLGLLEFEGRKVSSAADAGANVWIVWVRRPAEN